MITTNEDNHHHKLFLLDYSDMTSKQLVLPMLDQMILTNMFVLRNVVYFMTLHFTKKAEIYLMNKNYSFTIIQEIQEFPLKDKFTRETQFDEGLLSLPFYQ